MKVFIADDVNEDKLAPLVDAGIEVIKETGLAPEELAKRLADADGVIVRSATRITAELMDVAPNLRVIGRAGVGVDNIDVAAATARGIVVMNAPDGNTITTAEHAFALIISMCRNVPQAHAKLQAGTWDKKSFVGVELHGKTLGVIGLGRIGKHVSRIARGFGMNIVAYDPFCSADAAAELGMLMAPLDDVFAKADILTIHTPVTDETRGIIGREAFAKMKTGVRLVNAARGGLVDEEALVEALDEGRVAAAALDVFETEPLPADSPLLGRPNVITTPHLGASTAEAQQGVALTVAEQMRDLLIDGVLRGAVNAPAIDPAEAEALRPFMHLAERLGRFQAQITDNSTIAEIRLEYAGELSERTTSPITRAFLAGLLRDVSARVNAVNASLIADERGIEVVVQLSNSTKPGEPDIRTVVRTKDGEQSVAGRVFAGGESRITEIGGFSIEVGPAEDGRLQHLLVTKNLDVPGVIGEIGTSLGNAEVNISHFYLGRKERGGEALAVIEVDSPVGDDALAALGSIPAVILVRQVRL
jgi:D-3-phosphoglycerate dehydrogenase